MYMAERNNTKKRLEGRFYEIGTWYLVPLYLSLGFAFPAAANGFYCFYRADL